MTMLKRSEADGRGLGEYAADLPAGQYEAVCMDTIERHGVERRKYQSTDTEKVDLIAFVFEVTGKSGTKRQIRTREVRISTHEKSALFGFVSAWWGEPPIAGFDTDELIGCSARLTLEHVPSTTEPGRTYVRVTAIAPGAVPVKGGGR